jgi:hypothetical protein
MRTAWLLISLAACGRSSKPAGDGPRPVPPAPDAEPAPPPVVLEPACAPELALGISRDEVERTLEAAGIAFRDDEIRAYYEPQPGQPMVHTTDAAVAFECDGWRVRADIDDTDRVTLTSLRFESPGLDPAAASRIVEAYRAAHGAPTRSNANSDTWETASTTLIVGRFTNAGAAQLYITRSRR